ncbi:hypothetical protein A2U01_0058329 [Trifolium medium]|uniref:Uncharacterized protein n=1 Tax=Trifolium medium TaxID=97028 RepID=A0A392RNG8_9FABA|nr:hypothetical protein [Trifolium medium]
MSSGSKNGQKSTKVNLVNSGLREAQPGLRGAQLAEAKTCQPSLACARLHTYGSKALQGRFLPKSSQVHFELAKMAY